MVFMSDFIIFGGDFVFTADEDEVFIRHPCVDVVSNAWDFHKFYVDYLQISRVDYTLYTPSKRTSILSFSP